MMIVSSFNHSHINVAIINWSCYVDSMSDDEEEDDNDVDLSSL